jgi:rhodanese-related sulfurtransferase
VALDISKGGISVNIPEISREELQRRLGDRSLIILDVLPLESFAAGHIPGALHLPFAQLADRAREVLPDLSSDIAVYCARFT